MVQGGLDALLIHDHQVSAVIATAPSRINRTACVLRSHRNGAARGPRAMRHFLVAEPRTRPWAPDTSRGEGAGLRFPTGSDRLVVRAMTRSPTIMDQGRRSVKRRAAARVGSRWRAMCCDAGMWVQRTRRPQAATRRNRPPARTASATCEHRWRGIAERQRPAPRSRGGDPDGGLRPTTNSSDHQDQEQTHGATISGRHPRTAGARTVRHRSPPRSPRRCTSALLPPAPARPSPCAVDSRCHCVEPASPSVKCKAVAMQASSPTVAPSRSGGAHIRPARAAPAGRDPARSP